MNFEANHDFPIAGGALDDIVWGFRHAFRYGQRRLALQARSLAYHW
jgi:hypothetical protein